MVSPPRFTYGNFFRLVKELLLCVRFRTVLQSYNVFLFLQKFFNFFCILLSGWDSNPRNYSFFRSPFGVCPHNGALNHSATASYFFIQKSYQTFRFPQEFNKKPPESWGTSLEAWNIESVSTVLVLFMRHLFP